MTRRKTATTASLPSEVTNMRHWRTREDPFSTVWEQVREAVFAARQQMLARAALRSRLFVCRAVMIRYRWQSRESSGGARWPEVIHAILVCPARSRHPSARADPAAGLSTATSPTIPRPSRSALTAAPIQDVRREVTPISLFTPSIAWK